MHEARLRVYGVRDVFLLPHLFARKPQTSGPFGGYDATRSWAARSYNCDGTLLRSFSVLRNWISCCSLFPKHILMARSNGGRVAMATRSLR